MAANRCCSRSYLVLCNLVLFILSVGMMVLMIYMIATGSLSSVMAAFSELVSPTKAMWGALGAATLLMIASVMGLMFSCKKDRRYGCFYLVIVLLAVGLQVWMVVANAGGGRKVVNHIYNKFKDDKAVPAETDANDNKVMRDTFETFLNVFNNPKTPKQSQECSFGEEPQPVQALMALTEENMPWLRGGAAGAPLRKLGSKDECAPKEKAVTCKKDEAFGKTMTKICHALGHDEPFTQSCTGCREKFWSHWDIDSTFKENQLEEKFDLSEAFKGDVGTAYCRCLSSFIAQVQKNYWWIVAGGVAFLVLEVMLIFVTLYLMVCGPSDDRDNRELELSYNRQ